MGSADVRLAQSSTRFPLSAYDGSAPLMRGASLLQPQGVALPISPTSMLVLLGLICWWYLLHVFLHLTAHLRFRPVGPLLSCVYVFPGDLMQ